MFMNKYLKWTDRIDPMITRLYASTKQQKQIKMFKKVKRFLDRRLRLPAYEGGKFVTGCSYRLSAAGRIISMTLSGIVPDTFHLVLHCLNQLRYRVPPNKNRSQYICL
jgi:hypothetical protein